jgi:hypothetical protein
MFVFNIAHLIEGYTTSGNGRDQREAAEALPSKSCANIRRRASLLLDLHFLQSNIDKVHIVARKYMWILLVRVQARFQ